MKVLKNPIIRDSKSQNNLLTLKKYIISFFIVLILYTWVFSSSVACDKSVYVIKQYNVKVDITNSLKKEVKMYIDKIAPGSKVSADTLTNICLKYKINICFVLAQGHLESHFGTRGMATFTNSVFNVGTFDNGIIIRNYKTANQSLEPYVVLLISNYLNKEKSVDTLINNYKNKNGYRYAMANNYEEQLKIIYNRLKYNTNINNLQNLLY
jgi:flagellum-specific peptidoglycan hydrolase FlgJ